MTNQRLTSWPLLGTVTDVDIVQIIDEGSGLVLEIEARQQEVPFFIRFDAYFVYKVSHESYMLKTWQDVEYSSQTESLFKVKGSALLKNFHEETFEVYIDQPIQHYAIYTDDTCIDILSSSIPTVIATGDPHYDRLKG